MSKGKTPISLLILLSVIAFLFVNHGLFFYGHFGYDDMEYARLSHDLLQGNLNWDNHYSYRLSILGLTGLSYGVLGINDWSSALPALLLSCIILYLFYRHSKDHPWYVFVMMLIFYFAIRWNVFYSDKLMPDIYVSAFVFLAWYSYRNRGSSGWKAPVLFVSGLFGAFLAKGTVILILPLLATYFIYDIYTKKGAFWWRSISIGLPVLLVYFGLHQVFLGDAFARFDAIEGNAYFNSCSYSLMEFSETIKRLTTDFLSFIWREDFYIYAVIGLLPLLLSLIKKKKVTKPMLFYVGTIWISLLSMNFMTISLTSYNPTCLDPRHYLLFTPIMAVCSACIVWDIIQDFSSWKKAFAIVLLSTLIIPTIKYIQYGTKMNYSDTRSDIYKLIANEKESTLISNKVMTNLLRYYSEYKEDGRFLSTKELSHPLSKDVLLISNWYTEFHANTSMDKMMEESGLAKDDFQISRRDSSLLSVTIYRRSE